jgi:hypothetical protein
VLALAAAGPAMGAISADGVLRWWPALAPSQPAALRAWLDRATAVLLDSDGRILAR